MSDIYLDDFSKVKNGYYKGSKNQTKMLFSDKNNFQPLEVVENEILKKEAENFYTWQFLKRKKEFHKDFQSLLKNENVTSGELIDIQEKEKGTDFSSLLGLEIMKRKYKVTRIINPESNLWDQNISFSRSYKAPTRFLPLGVGSPEYFLNYFFPFDKSTEEIPGDSLHREDIAEYIQEKIVANFPKNNKAHFDPLDITREEQNVLLLAIDLQSSFVDDALVPFISFLREQHSNYTKRNAPHTLEKNQHVVKLKWKQYSRKELDLFLFLYDNIPENNTLEKGEWGKLSKEIHHLYGIKIGKTSIEDKYRQALNLTNSAPDIFFTITG